MITPCICIKCSSVTNSKGKTRREFMRTFSFLSAGGLFPSLVSAKDDAPKPENILSPDAALNRLMAGNKRYVRGSSKSYDYTSTRSQLNRAQNPYACVLGCSDSRVGPEICFDESLGDLFIARDAGNYLNVDMLASLEYGTAVLGAPLIMVLGHTECGAIKAAINAEENNTDFPGHIQNIASALSTAVHSVEAKGLRGNALLRAVTIANIKDNVRLLRRSTPILSRRISQGKLVVVGGLYNLESGQVDIVS